MTNDTLIIITHLETWHTLIAFNSYMTLRRGADGGCYGGDSMLRSGHKN